MPVITIDIGILETRQKKAELIKALTEAASSATKIPVERFIVQINELENDNIGIGGRLLSDILE
jgi:4-oxalocrotonate tautomerase